jgi:hypothetical protein
MESPIFACALYSRSASGLGTRLGERTPPALSRDLVRFQLGSLTSNTGFNRVLEFNGDHTTGSHPRRQQRAGGRRECSQRRSRVERWSHREQHRQHHCGGEHHHRLCEQEEEEEWSCQFAKTAGEVRPRIGSGTSSWKCAAPPNHVPEGRWRICDGVPLLSAVPCTSSYLPALSVTCEHHGPEHPASVRRQQRHPAQHGARGRGAHRQHAHRL